MRFVNAYYDNDERTKRKQSGPCTAWRALTICARSSLNIHSIFTTSLITKYIRMRWCYLMSGNNFRLGHQLILAINASAIRFDWISFNRKDDRFHEVALLRDDHPREEELADTGIAMYRSFGDALRWHSPLFHIPKQWNNEFLINFLMNLLEIFQGFENF